MSPHQCSECRMFIHDTLSVPISKDELYYGYYNLKCIPRLIPELVPEFQKLVSDHRFDLTQTPLRKYTTYIAIRLIESGSGDVISSDDIEEGSIVGQIVGEGGTIAKSSYYFPNSLNNLWTQGLSKFIDPYTRKPIKNVNWYTAHLVPAGSLGGRKKTRKVKKSKRTTFRKKRTQIRKLKKSRKQ